MMNTDETKVRDQSQNEVININRGRHLVLAPPGCGKTDILAERIKRALERGADPKSMACLTFTNRASRGMLARIQSNCGADTADIFVGNVHRFCSRFLFDNGYIPLTASILDENDVYGIFLSLIDRDEEDADNLEFEFKNKLDSIAHIASRMYQLRHHHETLLYDKDEAIDWLTGYFGCDELSLFANAEGYYEKLISEKLSSNEYRRGLNRVRLARRYAEYKKKFAALDFDDLLLKTYTALRDPANEHRRFTWLQIDEVQDLNPLQLAICDLLLADDKDTCVLYLGDEQQAIFSFMGASQEQLSSIKNRCQGNIHRLYNNYRSPSYLLDIYNTYANYQLDMDPALLPRPVKNEAPAPHDLMIVESENFSHEIGRALKFCRWVSRQPPRHENDHSHRNQ
ncbi:UvrD-helicase domain-containing protein [Succinimonas sp.]|uniref:UvrD-helicase domain-containing protein n=1 Tax=Succinimonas sp. TaxID=1936151 RepID=UPI00386928C6